MSVNPKTASWVNPTQATDENGATVPFDATTDLAGVEIAFDGAAAVAVPSATTSIDLTTLDAYMALPVGKHTLTVADVTKEGVVGQFSVAAEFQRAVVPFAPSAVVLA